MGPKEHEMTLYLTSLIYSLVQSRVVYILYLSVILSSLGHVFPRKTLECKEKSERISL